MSDLPSKFLYVFLMAPMQQIELQDHHCTQSILQTVWKPSILILHQGSYLQLYNFLFFSKFTYLEGFLVQKKYTVSCLIFFLSYSYKKILELNCMSKSFKVFYHITCTEANTSSYQKENPDYQLKASNSRQHTLFHKSKENYL